MAVGILGSGFGLYGYLPAMVRTGERVAMPARYRAKLLARPDVRDLDGSVEWVADDEAVLARSTTLVVSRRPADQVRDVGRALAHGTVKGFVLEKPLAPDPAAAQALLDDLDAQGSVLRIAFIFAYASWAQDLRHWLAGADEGDRMAITWSFRAHHYATNHETWKRHHDQGGGALRFYGIHVIALLAEFGYTDTVSSSIVGAQDEAEVWDAEFIGAGLPPCHIRVDSNAETTAFRLCGRGRHAALDGALVDPFEGVAAQGGFDRRVKFLMALCRSVVTNEAQPTWYRDSFALWAASERRAVRYPDDTWRGRRTSASLD